MQIRPLAISGAFEITPRQHGDERGGFLEWFKSEQFRDAAGHDLELAQANCSVSAAGVIRGIHFSDVPPGQAKYVDVRRRGRVRCRGRRTRRSPTFGSWEAVLLDDADRRAVYLGEGLGHAFMSLADGATVVYLCSTRHRAASTACTRSTADRHHLAVGRSGRPPDRAGAVGKDGGTPRHSPPPPRAGCCPITATVRAYQDSLSG